VPTYNLLFLWTDQQRADTLTAYGNRLIEMPNLNRLASESTVFDQAYVSQTVCTPSRSTVMTGLYPHTNGCLQNNIPLAPEIPVLPEMLSNDYLTGYFGKWHLGDEIFCQRGFDEWISIEDMYIPYYGPNRDRDARSSYHHFLIDQGLAPRNGSIFGRGEALRLPEELGKPAFLADQACEFLRRHRDNPFVLYVNMLEPHSPFFSCRDDQYDPAQIPLPPSFDDPPTVSQPLKTQALARRFYEHGQSGLPLKTEADWRRMIANYWGLNSLVDTYMGRILDTLEAQGLAEDTIVVYTSDHGDMMGDHRLITKCVMFEEAMRIPWLMRLPGQRQGRHVAGPISHIDLVPTLLDLMGEDIPDHLQGKSQSPVLHDEAATRLPPRDVVVEWNGDNSALGGFLEGDEWPEWLAPFGSPERLRKAVSDPVRTLITPEGWKFSYSPLGEHQLYDLNADPYERHNLAVKSEHLPLMRSLAERIARWQEAADDRVPVELERVSTVADE
jgi:arylsulfatase A-like enzyme